MLLLRHPCRPLVTLASREEKLLVGVAAHVRVWVGVRHSTVPHVSYTGTGSGTTAAAGGFVPTVSSNPAGIRRKLGTTIRGPTWQLEPWNLAGQARGRVARVGAPAGLNWQTADCEIGRLVGRAWSGGLQRGTDLIQRGSEKKGERGNREMSVVWGHFPSSWSRAVQPGAGTGASPSAWWPPVVSATKAQAGQNGQKAEPQCAGDRPAGPRTLNPDVWMLLSTPAIPDDPNQIAPDCSRLLLPCAPVPAFPNRRSPPALGPESHFAQSRLAGAVLRLHEL